jgi:hypothetical protein
VGACPGPAPLGQDSARIHQAYAVLAEPTPLEPVKAVLLPGPGLAAGQAVRLPSVRSRVIVAGCRGWATSVPARGPASPDP